MHGKPCYHAPGQKALKWSALLGVWCAVRFPAACLSSCHAVTPCRPLLTLAVVSGACLPPRSLVTSGCCPTDCPSPTMVMERQQEHQEDHPHQQQQACVPPAPSPQALWLVVLCLDPHRQQEQQQGAL
jgi:hypothetical protein